MQRDIRRSSRSTGTIYNLPWTQSPSYYSTVSWQVPAFRSFVISLSCSDKNACNTQGHYESETFTESEMASANDCCLLSSSPANQVPLIPQRCTTPIGLTSRALFPPSLNLTCPSRPTFSKKRVWTATVSASWSHHYGGPWRSTEHIWRHLSVSPWDCKLPESRAGIFYLTESTLPAYNRSIHVCG